MRSRLPRVGVDRESTVKKAEDLVREGKLDLAIEEYLRLVDDQPGDVGAANALGDLYAKVGNRAAAVAQFVQIGDSHRESGFVPKAVAFYKKALKVDPASDHALSQLAQIAVEQELYADATLYLNRLLQRRREQNNEAGVAECLVRLGGFPDGDRRRQDGGGACRRRPLRGRPRRRVSGWTPPTRSSAPAARARRVDVLMQAVQPRPRRRRRCGGAWPMACADDRADRSRARLPVVRDRRRSAATCCWRSRSMRWPRAATTTRAARSQRVIEVAPDRRAEAEALLAPLTGRSPAPSAPPSRRDV